MKAMSTDLGSCSRFSFFCRIKKCNGCYNHLCEVRVVIQKKQSSPGKLGQLYKEVQILMSVID